MRKILSRLWLSWASSVLTQSHALKCGNCLDFRVRAQNAVAFQNAIVSTAVLGQIEFCADIFSQTLPPDFPLTFQGRAVQKNPPSQIPDTRLQI